MKNLPAYRKNAFTSTGGVKIYIGALGVANQKGIKTSFLFFLLVKQISKTGTIFNYAEIIEQHTGLKKSKIYQEVKALKGFGLIKSGINRLGVPFITLSSISSLYQFLGFEVSKSFDANERSEDLHVPLSRLSYCKDVKELEAQIQKLEINRSLNKQEATIKEKFVHGQLSKKLGPDYKNKVSDSLKRKTRKYALRRFYTMNKAYHQLSSTAMLNTSINFDISVSTEKTASLFGYKSARSGTNIQRRLKKRGLIQVERRDELVYENVSLDVFQRSEFPPNYYFVDGSVRRRLTNKIKVL